MIPGSQIAVRANEKSTCTKSTAARRTQPGCVPCSIKRGQVEAKNAIDGALMITSVTQHDITPGPIIRRPLHMKTLLPGQTWYRRVMSEAFIPSLPPLSPLRSSAECSPSLPSLSMSAPSKRTPRQLIQCHHTLQCEQVSPPRKLACAAFAETIFFSVLA